MTRFPGLYTQKIDDIMTAPKNIAYKKQQKIHKHSYLNKSEQLI